MVLFCIDGDNDLRFIGVVGNHEDTGFGARFQQLIALGSNLQFGRFPCLERTLTQGYLQSVRKHLEGSNLQRCASCIGNLNLCLALRLTIEDDIHLFAGEIHLRSVHFLRRRLVAK